MAGDEKRPRESSRPRGAPRTLTCIPTYVESEHDPSRISVILDVSIAGARLGSTRSLVVGEHVKLSLHIGERGATVRAASGRVVRVAARPTEQSDIWKFDVAVEFDEPIDEYAAEIQQFVDNHFGPQKR